MKAREVKPGFVDQSWRENANPGNSLGLVKRLDCEVTLWAAAAGRIAVQIVNLRKVRAEGELILSSIEVDSSVVLITALRARQSKNDFLYVWNPVQSAAQTIAK